MKFLKPILVVTAAAFALNVQAQTLAGLFGDVKPTSAELQLVVKGHGKGAAFLNVTDFAGSSTAGVFNSGDFADKPVKFTATVEGSRLKIKTGTGYQMTAELKKQVEGTFTGDFTGDFSGSVTLKLK